MGNVKTVNFLLMNKWLHICISFKTQPPTRNLPEKICKMWVWRNPQSRMISGFRVVHFLFSNELNESYMIYLEVLFFQTAYWFRFRNTLLLYLFTLFYLVVRNILLMLVLYSSFISFLCVYNSYVFPSQFQLNFLS